MLNNVLDICRILVPQLLDIILCVGHMVITCFSDARLMWRNRSLLGFKVLEERTMHFAANEICCW